MVKAFIDLAKNKGDVGIRKTAMKALTPMATDPRVKAVLMDNAKNEKYRFVRADAVNALVSVATDPKVKAVLMDRAKNEKYQFVRADAVKALIPLVQEDAVRDLFIGIVMTELDKVFDVAFAALKPLAESGDQKVRAAFRGEAIKRAGVFAKFL